MTGVVPGTFKVLYPTNGTMATEFHRSLGAMERAYRNAGRVGFLGEIHDQTGANISKARNSLVEQFLRSEAEWAWFADADIVFSPDTVERLIANARLASEENDTDVKVISGLYVMVGQEAIEPHVYMDTGGGRLGRMKDYPDNAVMEVAGTGTGCLLIHRDVLEHIRREADHDYCWFAEAVVSGQWVSEDISFCLRARSLGYSVWVDTTTQVGHFKGGRVYWPPDCRRPAEYVPTYAVIPTKGTKGYVKDLVHQLADQDVAGVVILDNGCKRETRNWLDTQPGVTVLDAPDQGIHEMWNAGVAWCMSQAARCTIAILNDDLRLGDQALPRCADALRRDRHLIAVCPNYDGRTSTQAVIPTRDISVPQRIATQDGGLAGFAMVIKSEWFASGYAFPEECRWWFGDNDLVMAITASGYTCGIVTNAEVEHLDGGQNTGDWNDDHPADFDPARDREAFEARWAAIRARSAA